MADADIVEVYAAANAPDAHLLKGRLEDEGIQVTVVGEPLQSAAGDLPFFWSTSPRLWVARADYERAQQIIQQWERENRPGGAGSSGPWTCPRCHEEVPGDFDVCWNCEYSRAEASG